MISISVMKLLFLAYVVLLVVCVVEKKWTLVLYWLGACFIQLGIIVMGGK